MRRCCLVLLMTLSTCLAVPKQSAKSELQRLVRLPKLEFSAPLQFDRKFGFVAFPDPSTAAVDAARHLKDAKGLPEEAPLYLAAGRIHDRQGDQAGALRQYSRSIDLFRRRLEIAPRDASALAGLGDALTLIGRFAEARSVLDRAAERGTPSLENLLASARFHRERAWFAAAGEAQRYSSTSFLDQLTSMVAIGPAPSRIEEAKLFLAESGAALTRAGEMEPKNLDFLRERAAFHSFRAALETAFTQVQNGELRARALRLSIYKTGLEDLREAADLSGDPSIIAASALAMTLAVEAGGVAQPSADLWVRKMATRLQELADERGENSPAAAEFLGSIQFHLLKDMRGAQRTLRLALDEEPRRHRSWELLTLASAYQGAREFIEAAEARVEALPTPRSNALLVKSYDMHGDHLRAQWTALNAVSSYPNDFLMNLSLAVMLLKDENADSLLWRVEEALSKAEKALGSNPEPQSRLDFVLTKSVYLGISGRAEQARDLLRGLNSRAAEVLEILRVLDSSF